MLNTGVAITITAAVVATEASLTLAGNDGDAKLIDYHLKYVDHKENNGFFACLRGIHQNNRYSVPG
jgi:hypothetical protein